MPARPQLRASLRAARLALGAAARRSASRRIARRLRASPLYWRARHIALYWPLGSEADLRGFAATAQRERKTLYLPVMQADHTLRFARFDGIDGLRRNRQGILEPRAGGRTLAAGLLDLVCVPLLGFDRDGTRLGAGGGYYDRSFDFRRDPARRKPLLAGIAFACQECAPLTAAPWDVPLDAIVTERELICVDQRRKAR